MLFVRDNATYERVTKYEDKLVPVITGFLITSFKKLSDKGRDDREEIKEHKEIFENAYVKKYPPQLKSDLANATIIFDSYFSEIHFNDGYTI